MVMYIMIPMRRYTREIHQPNKKIYKTFPHVIKEPEKNREKSRRTQRDY